MLFLALIPIFLSSTICSAELSTNFQSFQRPPFDFGSIGNELQFGGNFDSISLYNYPSQKYLLSTDPSGFNTSYNTLYLEDSSNNQIYPVGNINGEVNIISAFKDSYIISGSFNSISLVDENDSTLQSSKNIGSLTLYNTSTNTFTNMDPNNELVGFVYTIYGDDTNNVVYIGGDFSFNKTYSLAVYDGSKSSLTFTSFKGFNKGSVVKSISRVSDDTIVFGGSFYELGVPQLQYTNQTYFLEFEESILSNSSSMTNSSIEDILIQTEQMVSFKYAYISADNTKSGKYEDLICPSTSNSWLTNDGQLGAWNARLPFSVSPSKIRIYNSREDGAGVKYFRLYTSPSNSIMNLTYIDPSTNKLASCDAWCPLLAFSDLNSKYEKINDSSLTNVSFSNSGGVAASIQWSNDYQDFGFINDLEVTYIDLQIVDFYGSNAGLNAVQMFTTEILTFANSTLNEDSCGSKDNNSYSEMTGGGWTLSSTGQYMVNTISDLSKASSESWGVTFYPNISYSGDYKIDYMTPGCQQDSTCPARGSVDVLFLDGNGNVLNKFTSAQTNEFNKIETVFDGHINITDGSRPSVQIKVSESGSSGTEVFVADKIGVTILSIDDLANSTNSTMGKIVTNSSVTFNSSEYKIPLNGLFEYSLKNFSSFPDPSTYNFSTPDFNNKYVGNSSINQFAASQLSNSARIDSLQYLNNTLYCGGDFKNVENSTSIINNLFGLSLTSTDNNNIGVSGTLDLADGLDGKVNDLLIYNDQLYIVGEFNGTSKSNVKVNNLGASSGNSSISHVAVLSQGNTWNSLGSGITQTTNLRYSSVASINGTMYLVFSESSPENLYIWNSASNEWINNSDFNNTGIFINITSAAISSSTSMMAGHISLLGLITRSSKTASLNSDGKLFQSSLQFKDSDNSVVNQFLFINSTLSIIAGKFITQQGNISNLLINNGGSYSTIENIDYNNTAINKISVDSNNRFLFISVNGVFTYSNSQKSNVLIYDLKYKNVTVPGLLSKNNGNETASVNSFYYDEKTNQLLVGGDFDLASSMTCQTVCFFDLNSNRWEYSSHNTFSAGSVVNYMNITNNDLFLTGLFNLNSSSSYFATYDFSKTSFSLETSIYNSNSKIAKRDNSTYGIPGAVSQYVLIDGSLGPDYRMLFMGSNYVSAYNTSSWTRLDRLNNELSSSSTFKKLEFINLTTKNSTKKSHTSNDYYFGSSQAALLVIGDIIFNSYGNIHVSAAVFNGTNWLPYIYTTSTSGKTAQVNDFMINKAISMDSLSSDFFKSLKMDRGWIVFIGLALALGTMMILSLGAMLILFWRRMRNDGGGIHQRIVEGDMLETVPPSKLFNEMDEFKFSD